MTPKIKRIGLLILVVSLSGLLLACMVGWTQAASFRVSPPAPATAEREPSSPSQVDDDSYLYLPMVSGSPPWPSPFGVEPYSSHDAREPVLHADRRAGRRLDSAWGSGCPGWSCSPTKTVRSSGSCWRRFENELRNLNAAGIKPLVTVTDSPAWARIDAEKPCSAIRADRFDEFAEFMRQLVLRYKEPEFNVHDWELGNEPDVAPELILDPASPFGCWGDLDDPYYGGRHYGEMLKAVAPAIRSADAKARIWNGGLLLIVPIRPAIPMQPTRLLPPGIIPGRHPPVRRCIEFRCPGFSCLPILQRDLPGAGSGQRDYDERLVPWGGLFVGKATFLRQTLQAYGVDKPLVINETSLICKYGCPPAGEVFFQRQADFLTRSYVRALANNITGLIWYTLEGPGWYDSGLLSYGTPKPVYRAYQNLTERLRYSRYLASVSYGAEIEAYAFDTRPEQVQVIWTRTDQVLSVLVPGEKFLAAYTRDGEVLTPTVVGPDYQFTAGFSPIFVVFSP